MDRLATLPELVQDAIGQYVGPLYKGNLYTAYDDDRNHYSLIAIPDANKTFKPSIILFARVVDERVFIDVDFTDRPLVDALVHAGIPREKIVLTYAGEAVPI
jgi:hypothetical protein